MRQKSRPHTRKLVQIMRGDAYDRSQGCYSPARSFFFAIRFSFPCRYLQDREGAEGEPLEEDEEIESLQAQGEERHVLIHFGCFRRFQFRLLMPCSKGGQQTPLPSSPLSCGSSPDTHAAIAEAQRHCRHASHLPGSTRK